MYSDEDRIKAVQAYPRHRGIKKSIVAVEESVEQKPLQR